MRYGRTTNLTVLAGSAKRKFLRRFDRITVLIQPAQFGADETRKLAAMMQAGPTKLWGDSMHYQSLIGLTAAALSLTFPSQAVAQSKPGQVRIAPQRATKWPSYRLEPVSFALQPKSVGYKLESASLASSSESTAETLPDDSMRVVPEQRTKSAAYKWEAAFLALSAIDAAETISCLNRATCTEHNPIWGSHPATGTIVAAKLGLGLVHFGVFKLIADRDPHTALRAAQVSTVVQGGVVMLNLHSAF